MQQPVAPVLERLVLGRDTEPLELTTSAEQREAVVRMLGQTRRSVRIISRHLDAAIYDSEAVVEACKSIALSNRRAWIRVLVQDISPVIRDGHRLVNLAKLSAALSKSGYPPRSMPASTMRCW